MKSIGKLRLESSYGCKWVSTRTSLSIHGIRTAAEQHATLLHEQQHHHSHHSPIIETSWTELVSKSSPPIGIECRCHSRIFLVAPRVKPKSQKRTRK
eukprot:6463630-Amphidinium_carterae.1